MASVYESTEAELAEIAKRDERLAAGPLAATALSLARELDGKNSATSKAMCAKALIETLERLRELMPPEERKDRVDEIAERRKRRLAAG